MFTKILPAGDLFNYVKGGKDSKGVEREKPAACIRGDDVAMTKLLIAQAAFGVRPKEARDRSPLPMRSHTEWVRHCQRHLVHIISCFHETDDRISPELDKIARATEDLILVGMPKDALHFSWYRHSQEKGTHSHGGMARILLNSCKPYEPKLRKELRWHFDRLVSRRLGFSDPVDPQGFRIVHGGRGSWKPQNFDIITSVCQEATKRWRANKLTKRGEFPKLLNEFDLTVVFEPDAFGRPVLQPKGAGIAAPCYPNTVVARREDTGGIIVFCGPACHGDFSADKWHARIDGRAKAAADLRLFPYKVFVEFERCVIRRFHEQRPESLHVEPEDCVYLKDFDWLKPGCKSWHEPKHSSRLTESDAFSPEMYWGDRLYAFVSDIDPEVEDITDPLQAPLREWIKEDYATLAAEEAELDKHPAATSDPAEQEAVPADIPERPNETPAPENEAAAPLNEIRHPSAKQPGGNSSPSQALEQRSETILPAFYRPENTWYRRRLQLEICRGIARQREKVRRVKKKREQTDQTDEKEPAVSLQKESANKPNIPPPIDELRGNTGLTEDEKPGGPGGPSAEMNEPDHSNLETNEEPEKRKAPEGEPGESDAPNEDVPPPDPPPSDIEM
jgi:hypothetical protein